MRLKITQNRSVTSIYIDLPDDREQWFLVQSDNHHDAVTCNRQLEKRHLDEAKSRGALIFMTGDFFDAMQGRFDPRRSMDALRPEYRVQNYFDVVPEDAAKFLAPYAENIVLIGKGNHESSILKNNNVDLTDRLVSALNRAGGHAVTGGYGGWLRVMVSHTGKQRGSVKIRYFHGAGGEAPVTRGTIQTNRQSVYWPDADVVINGHSHNAYEIPITRERISNKGNMFYDVCYHIRVPGYQMAYGDGSGGWEVERGGVPKPVGAYWLRVYWVTNGDNRRLAVQPVSAIEAPE